MWTIDQSSENSTARRLRQGRRVRAGMLALALASGICRGHADAAKVAALSVEGTGPGWCVFTDAEQPVIRLTLTRKDGDWQAPKCEITVYDFWHHQLAGVRSLTQAKGEQLSVTIQVDAPRVGWFWIDMTAEDAGEKVAIERMLDYGLGPNPVPQFLAPMFAVVPPPRTVAEVEDSPVAVDALVSTSTSSISNDLQVELTRRLGVRWARDRIAWQETEPEPGRFDWVGRSATDNLARHGQRVIHNAESFQRDGVRVLQVFHGIPRWAHAGTGPSFTTFPDDLRTVYRWTRDAATKLGAAVSAWSIWNEEDILYFCSEPPDQYAAMVKAAALGLRDAQPRPLILLGAFARDPRVGHYAQVLFANDVRPYVDCYDFHCYAPVATGVYAQAVQTNLEIARQAGFERSAIWVTETGWSFSKEASPADARAREAGVRYLLDAYGTGLASGIRRMFWFSLRPTLPGNGRQFGMVNANFEPFPVYSAMAAMAHTLGQGRFLGRCHISGTPVLLFQDGNTEVALVQATNAMTKLDAVPGATAWIDVMGAPHAFDRGGPAGKASVANGGWPFYVRGTAWADRIEKRGDVEPGAVPPAADPSRLVIRARFPREYMAADGGQMHENWDGIPTNRWAPRGYRVEAGAEVPVTVEVYNFTGSPAAGVVRAELPEGFRAEPASADFQIGPAGRFVIKFTIKTVQPPAGSEVRFTFTTRDDRDGSVAVATSQWRCDPEK